MAGMKSIDAAREALEDALLHVGLIVETCDELLPENRPSWLYLIGGQVRQVQELAEAYMQAVHQHARPVLDDMERAKAGLLR